MKLSSYSWLTLEHSSEGPIVFRWTLESVLSLLVRYSRSACGADVSVWRLRGKTWQPVVMLPDDKH